MVTIYEEFFMFVKRFFSHSFLTGLVCVVISLTGCNNHGHREDRVVFDRSVEIIGDKIFVQGQPFLIKAVGYAGWRPGQMPGVDKVDLSLVKEDFRRIKEAGFNTIRTWDALSPEELDLSVKYGLWVIQGIWLDPSHDWQDKVFCAQAIRYVQRVAQWSKPYPNILMYMVMTEPTQSSILYRGSKNTEGFLLKLKTILQQVDHAPVSMDSWLPIAFMDHSFLDVITFNTFSFVPESINKAIGYGNYVVWLKRNVAQNKPFFIGETGGYSVSQTRKNDFGFGGNTQEQQSSGDRRSVLEALKAGACGTSVVSWIDTWHYPDDPRVHGKDPWEWDGLLDVSLENKMGSPRKVYQDIKHMNQSLKEFPLTCSLAKPFQLELSFVGGNQKGMLKGWVKVRGKGLSMQKIRVGILFPNQWQEEFAKLVTDDQGRFIVNSSVHSREDQWAVVAVGFEKDRNEFAQIGFVSVVGESAFKEEGFYVFHDSNDPRNHFYPTGWIGDVNSIQLNSSWANGRMASTCLRIEYHPIPGARDHWAGIYWQNPAYNWKSPNGAYDLRPYKRLVFWARGEKGGEQISSVGVGGEKPNSFLLREGGITLTKDWQRYEIDLAGRDLSSVIHAFQLTVTGIEDPQGCTFYLDDIYFN
ncbi:MAG: hypothetical protein HQL15_04920 [Candidatus Omnitrophica bacterium]|nr:hypothetical protein [Candidatus Omnitrophota bacterium]